MVELGDKVKDTVTGFSGIAVCKVDYLQGCRRFGVQAPSKNNKKPDEWQYFDEPQLQVIKRGALKRPTIKLPRKRLTGGWQPAKAQK